MKNKLVSELYYRATDIKELENPVCREQYDQADSVVEKKMDELSKLVPRAMLDDLYDAIQRENEINCQQMFLTGLRSAIELLYCMTGTDEIEF